MTACDPAAPKAHVVTPIGNHRTATFSLFRPLLPFEFPRIGEKYRAVFKCWPEDYGQVKVLVIQVKGYRITKTPVTNVEKHKSTESVAGTERPKAESAAAAAKARSDSAVSQQVPEAESRQDKPLTTSGLKGPNRTEWPGGAVLVWSWCGLNASLLAPLRGIDTT